MMRTLLGFGASTMEGVGDSQGGAFARVSRDPRAQVIYTSFANHGIGGNTSRTMLPRAEALTIEGPFDTVVLLGCNDVPRTPDRNPPARTTVEEYTANLQRIFELVRGERSLFVTSFGVDSVRTGVQPDVFTRYMAAATATAMQHGYAVWDLHRDTLAAGPQFWAADGLHFNDAGHQYIADGILARLTSS